MYARVSKIQVREGTMDSVLHALNNQGFPSLQALPGSGDISIYVRRPELEILFISLWHTRDQAETLTTQQYRLDLLDRIQPNLDGPVETVVYEVYARG